MNQIKQTLRRHIRWRLSVWNNRHQFLRLNRELFISNKSREANPIESFPIRRFLAR